MANEGALVEVKEKRRYIEKTNTFDDETFGHCCAIPCNTLS